MAKSISVILELDDKNFVRGIKQADTSVDKLNTTAGSLTRTLGGIATAAAGAFAFKEVIETTARFQDLRTTLKSVEGSAQGAAGAFGFIQEFATQTQFGVEELTQTYIKLKTAGIEPTRELLTTFTDTAAVTTDQLGSLNAITDLFSRTVSGGLGLEELNRLADRGVPVFRILEEQLGLTRLEVSEFGKTAEGAQRITDALITGLNQEFGGATQDRLENLSTAMSNFGIAVTNSADVFGQGFAPQLAEATTLLNEFIVANQDTIAELGRLVGEGLKAVIENLDVIIPLLGAFATGIAAIKVVDLVKDIGNMTKALKAFNLVMKGNPVGLAIAGISAAVVLLITHWDDVKYAAQEFARLAELGMLKLAEFLLGGLSNAIQSVINLFNDLKAVATAVGAGIAAAFSDPLNATEAFKQAFNETMKEVKDAAEDVVPPFTEELAALKKRQDELSVATQRVETETKALANTTEDAAKAAKEHKEQTQETVDAADDLNAQFNEYISQLKETGIETKKTTREREIEKRVMAEQEKAAKALGVTIAKLSEEQKDAIREIVELKVEEEEAQKKAADAAVKAAQDAIDAEQKKQDEIRRTLELVDQYYTEAVAGAENYRKQLEMEGEQVRALTGLYGTERDVAEELYEFRKKSAADIAKLEAAEQALREKGADEEADQVAQKIENLKKAVKEEEEAIAEVARANSEYQRSFEYGWRESFAAFADDATNSALIAGRVFNTFAQGMSDALYNFAMTGKLSFDDLVDSMKSTIVRFLADRITYEFLNFLDQAIFGSRAVGATTGGMGTGGTAGGTTGGTRSSGGASRGGGGGLGSVIGGVIDKVGDFFGFADGGYIPGNKVSIVGEQGPELFMPAASGTIVPNFALQRSGGAGGGGTVNYTINAIDARSFVDLLSTQPELIHSMVVRQEQKMMSRRF